jgi:type VI secretion system protein ImpA
MLDLPLRSTPIVAAGYSFLVYKDSRVVGYEDQVKTDKDRKNRETMLQNGKLAPEVFDKAFAETPKAFYTQTEKDLDACLETVAQIDAFCDEKFAGDSPGFGKLEAALKDIRHTIHQLLEKKREKEPDPVEAPPAEIETQGDGAPEARQEQTEANISAPFTAEPQDRQQAIAAIMAAASFLRKREPTSPAPYLLLRGLRWGELRSAVRLAESPLLEAPPTEVRQQIKRMAIAKRWAELLETGEQALGLPGSRAWFDLQRLSVTACNALGDDYKAIATAITSELRALLNDLPELLDATLLDDTPAANRETRAWLESLGKTAPAAVPEGEELTANEPPAHSNGAPRWLAQALDAYALARDALASGQEERAFTIMREELARERSGRRRFRRTMQLIELAVSAGKDDIAQPLLEDVAAAIETHKLDAWEDPAQIADDLSRLMRYSKKIQGSSSEKQKLFERICRLDPVKALNAG